MTRFTPTKSHNPCPVCTNITGKCKTVDDRPEVLCMTFVDGYKGEITNGYKYSKPAKNGSWGIWYPTDGDNTFNREKWQQERKTRQEQAKLEKAWQQQNSLTNEQRAIAWDEIIAGLTLADDHRQKFLDRGFTQEQIDLGKFRTIDKYQPIKSGNSNLAGVSSDGKRLTNSGRGILTPIKDDCDRIVGCQIRLDDGGDGGRYRWLSSTSWGGAKPNLQNDELPIGIYFGDRSSRILGIAEGASIKPQLAANKFGINIIGAAGGQWSSSPEQLKAYLDKYHDKTKPVRIFPDAGSHHDDAVMVRLSKLTGLLQSWGYEVAIAWYGQFNKTDGDIDEITQEQFDEIEYISPSDFEQQNTYVLRKPDVVLNRRYLAQPKGFGDTFDILNDIPNGKFAVGCKSFKNTGKNYLQKLLADQTHKSEAPKPILYVTQLTHLVKEASSIKKLGLVNIYDIENAKSDDIRRELLLEASIYGLAVTYDSEHKIKALMPDFVPYQTFLDEAESGCEGLLDAGTEIVKHRTPTFSHLSELMHRSKTKYDDARMFMFDSDLTNVAVDYFCYLAGETLKDAFIIRNDYKVAQGKTAYIYPNNESWLDAYTQSSDRTICFSSSQKIDSTFSAQGLAQLTGDALIIDAETTKDKTHDAFRILENDPTPIMRKYQRTVHTSSMGIGISIEEEGLFDSRWAISSGLLGVGKFLQTTDRFRPDSDLHIFVPKYSTIGKYGSGSTNWKTLAKQSIKNNSDHFKAMLIADIENGTTLLHKSIETHSKFMARRNYELANYAQCVERQLRLDGYKIVKVFPDSKITDTIDKLREIRDTNVENYCEAVPQADISDELELKRIAAKQERDPDERLKFAKKKLSDRYLIPVTPQLVKQDMDGIYSKLRLNYYLTVGAEYLSDRDKASLETLLGDDNLLFAPDANKWLLTGKIALLHKIGLPDFLDNVGEDELTNLDSRAIEFNQKLISDFYRFPLLRHFGLKIDTKAKPLTNIEKVLSCVGRILTKDEEKKRQKKAGGYQIRAISDLESAIFENWLSRDLHKKNDTSNPETTILRRQFPNNNIVIGELPTIGDSQEPMREISVMAIAPIPIAQTNSKEDLQPSPNNILLLHGVVPSNKPTQPPKNAIQWQKGMRAMYQGTDWVIGTLGTATAKIVRNGFELWVDIPELAIA